MNHYLISSVGVMGAIDSVEAMADTEADALRTAQIDKRYLIAIRKRHTILDRLVSTSKMSRVEALSYYEGLAQLLESGLTLTVSLSVIARRTEPTGDVSSQKRNPGRILASAQLQNLAAGMTPSEAINLSHGKQYRLLTALVRAGEQNGELEMCLRRYCQLEQSSLSLRKKLVSASLYPVGMLAFSLLVVLFLFFFVIPKFASLMESSTKTLPLPSQIVFGISKLLTDYPVLVLSLLLLFLALPLLAWKVSWLRNALSASIRQIPTFRSLEEGSTRARVNRVLSALLGGGTPLFFAIEQAAAGLEVNARSRLDRCRALIASGAKPSSAFLEAGLASDVDAQLMASAERGGQLAQMLERIATMQEQSVLQRAERLTSLYSPVLMFIVAIVVATVVIALYWPLLDVFDSVR